MQFNSLVFGLFFPVAFILYWLIGGQRWRWQNVLLLLANAVFYGWWDWRFRGLLLAAATADYGLGRAMGRAEKTAVRRLWFSLSLGMNLALLRTFKYFGFVAQSLASLLQACGSILPRRDLGLSHTRSLR